MGESVTLSPGDSNALNRFDEVKAMLEKQKVLVFLDYDGTLSPIVKDPDRALMSEEMRNMLKELKNTFTVGVMSGRSLPKVKNFVDVDGIFYAGSHGFDIEGPDGVSVKYRVAEDALPVLELAEKELKAAVADVPGAYVENNDFSLSLHYRQCDPAAVPAIEEKLNKVVEANSDVIKKTMGKKVFELRPKVDWNKGRALNYILETLGLSKDDSIFTIYIGDDVTDEDVFANLGQNSTLKGLGIVVSDCEKETKASLSLHNPEEVRQFLSKLTTHGNDQGWKPVL